MREEDRKNQERNTIAIRNQICNETCMKYIRTDLLGLCRGLFSLKKSIYLPILVILFYYLTYFSLVFQSTFYKFIVSGFLGLSPSILGQGLKSGPYTTHPVWGFSLCEASYPQSPNIVTICEPYNLYEHSH